MLKHFNKVEQKQSLTDYILSQDLTNFMWIKRHYLGENVQLGEELFLNLVELINFKHIHPNTVCFCSEMLFQKYLICYYKICSTIAISKFRYVSSIKRYIYL